MFSFFYMSCYKIINNFSHVKTISMLLVYANRFPKLSKNSYHARLHFRKEGILLTSIFYVTKLYIFRIFLTARAIIIKVGSRYGNVATHYWMKTPTVNHLVQNYEISIPILKSLVEGFFYSLNKMIYFLIFCINNFLYLYHCHAVDSNSIAIVSNILTVSIKNLICYYLNIKQTTNVCVSRWIFNEYIFLK